MYFVDINRIIGYIKNRISNKYVLNLVTLFCKGMLIVCILEYFVRQIA